VNDSVDITSKGKTYNPALIILATILGPMIQEIDSMVVGVALPHMRGQFSAAPDQISWVLTTFLIGVAVTMPATGTLASKFGRKRVLIVAIVGFTMTSALAGLAGSLNELIAIRFIQGGFGAVLTPLSMSTLLDNFPRENHGMALGWWGVGIMVAPILGPTVGAFIAEHFTWRGVFFINVPFGILACVVISSNVPVRIKRDIKDFNYSGFLMIAFSAGSLQYILDQGERLDWFDAGKIIAAALIAGIALYGFVLNTIFAQNPFLDYRVLMDRNFCAGMILKVLLSIILVSIIALLPPFLIDLWNYPIITAGLVIAPRGVGVVLSVILVGYLMKHFDSRPLMAFGMVLAAYSTWLMAGYTSSVTPWDLVVVNFIQGIGWSFLFVPLTAATFSTLNPRHMDVAAGLYGLVGNLGKSVGVSILVGFYVRDTQANRAGLIAHVSPFNEAMQHTPLPELWDINGLASLVALDGEVTRQSNFMAYTNDFRLLTFIILACLPLVFLMRRDDTRNEDVGVDGKLAEQKRQISV
jgi:MFS transporter, DHA2 family, multidrug resistance protein